jgi:hypothetical protein
MVRIRFPPAKSRPRTSRAKSNPLSPGNEGSNPALSSGESVLRTAPIPSHRASIRSLRQWVPSGMARGAPKISKIGWRNAPKTPPKRARRGSRKERPGWAGCRATVVVISPPDVSLTGSVYDLHAAWVFISDQASHAGRRRDLLPWRCSFPRRPALPLRSRFKDHVERRLGCAPDAREAAGSDDLAQFCLTSLRAKAAVAAESR